MTESLIQETAKNGRKKDSLDRRLPAKKKKKRFPVPSRKLMHCLTRHAHMHVRQQPKQRRQQKQKQTKKKRRLVPHESWGAMPARRIRKKNIKDLLLPGAE